MKVCLVPTCRRWWMGWEYLPGGRAGCAGRRVTVISGRSRRSGKVCPVPGNVRLGRTITAGVRGLGRLLRAIRRQVRRGRLQYTPCAYARCGLGWASRSCHPRVRLPCKVAVALHEPWIHFRAAPGDACRGMARLTGYMVGACHRVIVTTEEARRRSTPRLPGGGNVSVVPVSSNIPVVECDRAAARAHLGVGDGRRSLPSSACRTGTATMRRPSAACTPDCRNTPAAW